MLVWCAFYFYLFIFFALIAWKMVGVPLIFLKIPRREKAVSPNSIPNLISHYNIGWTTVPILCVAQKWYYLWPGAHVTATVLDANYKFWCRSEIRFCVQHSIPVPFRTGCNSTVTQLHTFTTTALCLWKSHIKQLNIKIPSSVNFLYRMIQLYIIASESFDTLHIGAAESFGISRKIICSISVVDYFLLQEITDFYAKDSYFEIHV